VLKPAPEGVVIEGERSVKTCRQKACCRFPDSQSDRVELYHHANFRADPGVRRNSLLPTEQTMGAHDDLELTSLLSSRTLIRNLPDVVWIKAADGTYLACNAGFEQLVGAPEGEIVGKTDYDLLEREQAHAFRNRDREVLATATPTVQESWVALHDGTRKLLHTVLTPLRQGELIAAVLCVARDITPVRSAEHAMPNDSSHEEAQLRGVPFQNAREEVYGAIIQHAEDGIVLIDTQTLRFAEFNDAACRELGYTREEFAELTVADVQGVLTSEDVNQLVARALQAGAAKFETKHRMKNGALRERHISHRMVHIAERSYLASIWHDITEATRASQEMRASEARNSSLVSALAEGVLLIGADGRIETCNPAAQRILGMSVAEMSGLVEPTQQWQPIGEDGAVLHPQYLPPLQTLTTGQPQHGVIVGVRKRNGAQIWVSMNAVPIFAEQGRSPVAVVASFVDITERRTVEQQLRKLSLAVAQSPHSVVITDLNARVEYVNDAFLECTRADPADVLGRKLFEQAAHGVQATHTELWRALQDGTPWEGELVNYRSGGERYIDHARVTPIHQPDGRITHCVTILEDITERKNNAAELERHRHHLEEMVAERTEQLQAANRIVSDRAAEISDLYNHAPCGYHSVDTNADFVAITTPSSPGSAIDVRRSSAGST